MGTRGLTGFVLKGKKYFTYNHFDSYPEYLGMQMLEFCKEIQPKIPDIVAELSARDGVLGSAVFLVTTDYDAPKEYREKYAQYGNTSVSNQTLVDWYCLLRELQGIGILREIFAGNVNHMIDNHEFLDDELFCEWAYIINFDDNTLEVYHNGNNMLYAYDLGKLPRFMVGVTNEFKKSYKGV